MKYLIKKPETFLDSLNNDINTILHRNFDNLFPEYLFNQEIKGIAMPVDVKEYDNEYKLKVELPGIKKDDIIIDINKNSVTISAHKAVEKEEHDKKKKYHKSEFKYGEYSRTIYFPQEIDIKSSEANLKHGVLAIDLQKLQKEQDKTSKLEIKEK